MSWKVGDFIFCEGSTMLVFPFGHWFQKSIWVLVLEESHTCFHMGFMDTLVWTNIHFWTNKNWHICNMNSSELSQLRATTAHYKFLRFQCEHFISRLNRVVAHHNWYKRSFNHHIACSFPGGNLSSIFWNIFIRIQVELKWKCLVS